MAVGWGSNTAATQLTSVSTEQIFTTKPQLDANEYAHCQVTGNSDGTTDNLIIAVYAMVDGTNYDDVPIYEFELDCTDGNDNAVSFIVKDVYQFQIGVRRSGSTDTFTADLDSRIATMS